MPDLTLAYSTVQLISYIHLSTFSDGRTTISSHGSLGYEPRKEEVKVLFGQSLFFSLQVEFPEVHEFQVRSDGSSLIRNNTNYKSERLEKKTTNSNHATFHLIQDPD